MPNEISEIVGTKLVHRSADFLLADGIRANDPTDRVGLDEGALLSYQNGMRGAWGSHFSRRTHFHCT
jgi:hypothetical protein